MSTNTFNEPRNLTADAAPHSQASTSKPEVIAVFRKHDAARAAIRALQASGFDMQQVSLIGKDYHTEERPVGYYNRGDRIKVWGKRGVFWGALIGILLSPAFMFVPMLGHVFIFGPLAASVAGGIEGAAMVGGASALAAALYSIGIPRDSVIRYEAAIQADKFVVLVHDAGNNAVEAAEILRGAGAESVDAYKK